MSKNNIDPQQENSAQGDIEQIWSNVWRSQQAVNADSVFRHPLFVSGCRALVRNLGRLDGRVLEAGGGTGRYGIEIASRNPQARVDVIDISQDSITTGERLARERAVQNVSFQVADIMALPFPEGSYDCVLSDAVIQVFENYTAAVSEMGRVLRPGGIMLVAVCNYWNPHTLYKWLLSVLGRPYKYGYEKSFTHRELAQAMNDCGLRVIRTDGFAAGYGAARLQYLPFRLLGRLIDLIAYCVDRITRGAFSRMFGFEILVVATKPGVDAVRVPAS